MTFVGLHTSEAESFHALLLQTWEVHTGNRPTRINAGRQADDTQLLVTSEPDTSPACCTFLAIKMKKTRRPRQMLADASGGSFPSFPVFALLWAKAPIIGGAGGITCLLALLPLPQPCDERRIDEDTLGWIISRVHLYQKTITSRWDYSPDTQPHYWPFRPPLHPFSCHELIAWQAPNSFKQAMAVTVRTICAGSGWFMP